MIYSLCIEMLFKEKDFYDRLEMVKNAGFGHFEFWTWKDKDVNRIRSSAKALGLSVASFSGDDQYSMVCETENDLYVQFVENSIETAKILDCKHLVIHSDQLLPDGSARRTNSLDDEQKMANMVKVLKQLSRIAEKEKVSLVFEPLNTLVDHRYYFANDPQAAFDLIDEVGSEYVKVLYDVYHMQIMKGNVIETIEKNISRIGYVHFADVPGRHEPGTGELNCKNILMKLSDLRFNGIVGFELFPQRDSILAIERIKDVLVSAL